MGYQDIFYQNEEQYYLSNQLHFKKFIEDFKVQTGIDVRMEAIRFGISPRDYRSMFFYLKYKVKLCYPSYISFFYQLLEDSGYDVSSLVIEAMKQLGKGPRDQDVFDYVKLSPYIDEVTTMKDKVTIHSETFGDFSFLPLRTYFRENKKALYLLKYFQTIGCCHQMSWELIKTLENSRLITSLLPSYYVGTYYHTVICDQNEFIVDAANEIVYDQETQDFLFQGTIVSNTKKEELEVQLAKAVAFEDEESKKKQFPKALLLALHSEMKNKR